MDSTQGRPASGQPPARGDGQGVAVAAYVALFLLGMVQGLIGTFQYSRGPVPLAAICFDLAILATCVLGSWGMRSALGGVLPAAGWLVVTVVLSSVPAGGSILVTANSAGEWFLFGGSLSAAAGGLYAFARWGRPRRHGKSDPGAGR
ncbi:MAG TPA: DUF6113 family protein [Streptosporangiaceae bacterium]